MAKCVVLCWQEVPSVVEAKDSSGTHKIQLSERFQELIDMVAMRRGLDGTDDYLMEWRKEPAIERPGTPEEAAKSLAAEIEARYEHYKSEGIRISQEMKKGS
ncbi:MAG: hypothetical protein GC150_05645 [Rhizobiales bacterium]|nr:hypothetical protein [Hyphomicrobiales bacterium]